MSRGYGKLVPGDIFCNYLSLRENLTPAYTINGSTDSNNLGNHTDIRKLTWDAAICNFSASGYRLPTEMEYMWAAMGATSDALSGDIVAVVSIQVAITRAMPEVRKPEGYRQI